MNPLTIQPPEPMQQQLTRQIREQILSGALPAGSRLAPASELARRMRTSAFTVHKALVPLVNEGLIERKPRRGSYVRRNKATEALTVAVYFSHATPVRNHLEFAHNLQKGLVAKLSAAGYRAWACVDARPKGEHCEPCAELAAALRARALDAIAVAVAYSIDMARLRELGVPIVWMGASAPGVARVWVDSHQFLRLALRRLKEMGCRRIAFISSGGTADPPGGTISSHFDLYLHYMETCQELGVECRNAWVRCPELGLDDHHELFGYAECKRLFEQPEPPDGLIVYPDAVATGAALAVSEMPESERPRLLFHRNKRSTLAFPPLRASWVTSDDDAIVDAFVTQIKRMIAGEEATPILIPLEISQGEELPPNSSPFWPRATSAASRPSQPLHP